VLLEKLYQQLPENQSLKKSFKKALKYIWQAGKRFYICTPQEVKFLSYFGKTGLGK
jgi:hypothetical protein